MKVGLIYPQNELGDPTAVKVIGQAAEELGYEHVLAYDHVLGSPHDREPKLWGPYTDKHPFHDPFVMFAYLAGITTRIQFVTGILILPQRQTALVARQAADLDLLSDERFRMGVGIGWNYVEYDALGQDFSTRGRRVAEQVPLLRRLWSEPLLSFEGEFDHIDRAALVPRPRRQIPILMGGFAEVAVKRAARIADGFIFADRAGESFDMLPKLEAELEANGRGEGFVKHCNMLQPKTADEVVAFASRWRDAGGTHVSVNSMGMGHADAAAHVAWFEEVAGALRAAKMI